MAAQVTPFLPKPIDGASSTTENPLQEVRVINATEESVVAEVPPYPCLDIVFCDTRVRTFGLHIDVKIRFDAYLRTIG